MYCKSLPYDTAANTAIWSACGINTFDTYIIYSSQTTANGNRRHRRRRRLANNPLEFVAIPLHIAPYSPRKSEPSQNECERFFPSIYFQSMAETTQTDARHACKRIGRHTAHARARSPESWARISAHGICTVNVFAYVKRAHAVAVLKMLRLVVPYYVQWQLIPKKQYCNINVDF